MNDSHRQVQYAQDKFLDIVMERMALRSDAAFARMLNVTPAVISNVRRGKCSISATLLIVMHQQTGLSIKELREMMGDRRKKFRISATSFLPDEKRVKQVLPITQCVAWPGGQANGGINPNAPS